MNKGKAEEQKTTKKPAKKAALAPSLQSTQRSKSATNKKKTAKKPATTKKVAAAAAKATVAVELLAKEAISATAATKKTTTRKPATTKKTTTKKAASKTATAKPTTKKTSTKKATTKKAATTKAAKPTTKRSAATVTSPAAKKPATAKSTTQEAPAPATPKPAKRKQEDVTQASSQPSAKRRGTSKQIRYSRKQIGPSPSFRPLWPDASTREQGILLSFGSGDMSQLGLGSGEAMRERKFPTVLKSLNQVVAVSVGSLHNAALTSAGVVYTWGCNDDAALGRDGDEWLPNPVDLNGVVKVCCGASHTLALTNEGVVYSWGTYRNGQGVMGVIGDEGEKKGEDDTKVSRPTIVTSLKEVVDIACGDAISVALTRHGGVFQWGDIANGQRISARLNAMRLEPHRVLFKNHGVIQPTTIKRVYAGGYSVFAVDAAGVVWGWGPNNYNQIGLDSDPGSLWVCSPRPLEALVGSPVVDLAAALHHTICVNDKGQVYTFGRGSSGRLGHGDENDRKVPTAVAALGALPGDKVVRVACGEAHTCCVTEAGELYTFGNGDLNQLGNGDESDVLLPYHVQGQQLVVAKRRVLAAGCGSQHTVIFTTPGDASLIQKTPAPAKSGGLEGAVSTTSVEFKSPSTSSTVGFGSPAVLGSPSVLISTSSSSANPISISICSSSCVGTPGSAPSAFSSSSMVSMETVSVQTSFVSSNNLEVTSVQVTSSSAIPAASSASMIPASSSTAASSVSAASSSVPVDSSSSVPVDSSSSVPVASSSSVPVASPSVPTASSSSETASSVAPVSLVASSYDAVDSSNALVEDLPEPDEADIAYVTAS